MNTGENEIGPLTKLELEELQSLSEDERNFIDRVLYNSTDWQWKKVAFVVSSVFLSDKDFSCNIPTRYCIDRLQFMIDRGGLESVGNILRIRRSEIRRLK